MPVAAATRPMRNLYRQPVQFRGQRLLAVSVFGLTIPEPRRTVTNKVVS